MNDSVEEILNIKNEISSSFKTYDDFAAWLLAQQDEAKRAGKTFLAT